MASVAPRCSKLGDKKKTSFVHLHVHSEFSLLDGVSRIPEIVARARAFHMPALALTDHGNLHAVVQFYQEARRADVKPIIGCELYLAQRSRFDKETKEDRSPYHLTVLAKNAIGYKNLVQLATRASVEGFYSRPRVDKELLTKYAEGLIVLSGCPASEVSEIALAGREDALAESIEFYKDLYREDFYIEIQRHGLEIEQRLFGKLLDIAKRFEIPIVATNDSHYTLKEDDRLQDTMICIQTGKLLDDPNRLRFEVPEFYIKGPDEMQELFSDFPEAIHNTLAIAEKCEFEMELGINRMPEFPLPDGETANAYLKRLTMDGVKKRYGVLANDGSALVPPEVLKRTEWELSVICGKELASYFLIVQDFINFAKSKDIQVGPGRGSAAGSLVAYALGITEVDPLKHGLFFERFLNPERKSLPDIDVDFCFERRPEVLQYVMEKYGTDHVAQIVTFGTMAARASIRDVGRVLGVPLARVDRLAKLVPAQVGMTLSRAMELEPELVKAAKEDVEIQALLDLAKRIEGMVRHASVHAAGVVISKEPITEYVALQKVSDSPQLVTQIVMEDLEKIGLLKMDFLGLRNLTLIGKAVARISEESAGEALDLRTLDFKDDRTFALLASGESAGIFQLESRGMRQLLKQLQPSSFADIVASVALFRPGPLESGMVDEFIARKHGKTRITYDLPELEPILEESYGTIIYQEQVMEIAKRIAGFSPGEADVLRRAMGKKQKEEMAEQKEKFVEGAVNRGVAHNRAAHLFNLCSKHAGYSFNKSHSASYAIISYQTAFLKAHFPVPFMAALLSSVSGSVEKVAVYISECRRMGIEVLPPDVNESGADFTPVVEKIRFGLEAIKNLGMVAVEKILSERRENGSYTGIAEFVGRMDSRVVNKRSLEALIKAGAFDSVGVDRFQALDRIGDIMQKGAEGRGSRSKGQGVLFDVTSQEEGELPDSSISNASRPKIEEVLRFEKEVLGLFISDHPARFLEKEFSDRNLTPVNELSEKRDRTSVAVGGIVTSTRKLTTKAGELMMVGTLEDVSGSIPFVIFPSVYRDVAQKVTQEGLFIFHGTVDRRREELQVIVDRVEQLQMVPKQRVLHIQLDRLEGREQLAVLRDRLSEYPGEDPIALHMNGGGVEIPEGTHVAISPQLLIAIEELVGEGGVWIDRAEAQVG